MKKSITYFGCSNWLAKMAMSLMLLFSMNGISLAQPGACAVPCNGQVNISLDANGQALIDPLLVWQTGASASCYPNLMSVTVTVAGQSSSYSSTLNDAFGNPLLNSMGTTIATSSAIVDCGLVGQNVQYNLIKNYVDGTSNQCWGNLLVEDKLKPTIVCTDVTVFCNEGTTPSDLSNAGLPAYPTAYDNCDQNLDYDYTDLIVDFDCDTYINGLYITGAVERTWTVTDNHGNSSSCTQKIYLQRATLYDVAFPPNYDGYDQPVLSCTDNPDNVAATGYPTLNGVNILFKGSCEMSATFEDQVIPQCGGSFKVLRKWTIIDWCHADPVNYPGDLYDVEPVLVHTQIIKFLDQVAPSISCAADITLGTSNTSCTASTILPPASVSDNCSNFSVQTITPNGTINGNGGAVYNLPFGTSTITYVATDECGNVSECTLEVTVEDNVAPIAVCDLNTTVSLGFDGAAQVCSATFDDGSYDNCGDIDISIRRMDTPSFPFGDCIDVFCSDIVDGVQVVLRVVDGSDNTNTCMVNLTVEDKIAPIIVCPTDKVLDCTDDYTNTALTGYATANDNCGIASIDYTDNANIDDCGQGVVFRTFTAIDNQGIIVSCVQKITLVNNNPFFITDIDATNANPNDGVVWPKDYTTNDCVDDISIFDPQYLPLTYNEPHVFESDCGMIGVSHQDKLLDLNAPACFKIIRTWKVIDWCQFDPNSNSTAGYWEYNQVIKVIDDEAPVIAGPADIIVDNFTSNCGAQFVDIDIATATDCADNVTITNDSPYANGGGADASGSYPNGTTTVTFTAIDHCGNASTYSFDVKVADGKKPTPVCLNGLSVDLMPNSGMVTLWASDFESGSSYDNCTAYNNLKISFSSDVSETYAQFTCLDLGTNIVQIWVTDEAGNQDYCETYVIVQDNMGACSNNPQFALIEGNIEDETGQDVEDVEVEISGSNAIPYMTGNDGEYLFNNLALGSNYNVAPEKDVNPLNGVSTFDLVLISQHILGLQDLGSPYKMIAADANNSGSITTLDLVQIRRLILNIDQNFTNNTSWRFVDKDFVFANPANPFATTFPEVIAINNMTQNEIADFVAVKVGDVNCTAIPNNMLGSATRNADGTLLFSLEDKKFAANETFTVDFKAKDFKKVLGYQFTLGFDAATLQVNDVLAGSLKNMTNGNFGLSMLNEGVLTASWNDFETTSIDDNEVLFSIEFTALANGQLSETLEITSKVTRAEAYADNSQLDVSLEFNSEEGTTLVGGAFDLYQNQPNPVVNSTTIAFNLPTATNATLTISDISGRTLKVINQDFAQGYNEISLEKEELNVSGILYYRLDTPNHTATKKMILIN